MDRAFVRSDAPSHAPTRYSIANLTHPRRTLPPSFFLILHCSLPHTDATCYFAAAHRCSLPPFLFHDLHDHRGFLPPFLFHGLHNHWRSLPLFLLHYLHAALLHSPTTYEDDGGGFNEVGRFCLDLSPPFPPPPPLLLLLLLLYWI